MMGAMLMSCLRLLPRNYRGVGGENLDDIRGDASAFFDDLGTSGQKPLS